MTFAREKRLLLGWLALLAPLPLPFNAIVGWPSTALYLVGAAAFLRRAARGDDRWLPAWGMNLLALCYLPFFFLDLLVLGQGQLVGPVVRLGLFALLVKLWAIGQERDKWQVALGVFFVFLAAMGTSVHPSIVVYLIVFVALTLRLLARFAYLHVLAGFGRVDLPAPELPVSRFVAGATVATLLIAVPLFAVLPRVRSPYLVARGSGLQTSDEAAGFSDQVTLDSIGRIRSSREVALRLAYQDGVPAHGEVRLKAATYDVYQGGSWRRSPTASLLQRTMPARRFVLGRAAVERWAEIRLEPMRSRSLPLPLETVAVDGGGMRNLLVDQGGAVELGALPTDVVAYRVGLGNAPLLTGVTPRALPAEPTLDLSGATSRMSELARQVMGQGSAEERARRLESYLIQNYGYTVDFVGRSAESPLEDFLFRYKSGHCEYFASAMVLMLRSQGIPARLVTGFLGAEYSLFEETYLVRDSNAHAWVEAWLPGEGWRMLDPTPPAGRPANERRSGVMLVRQAWEYMVFTWDRYVLTFGLYDQLQIFRTLHGAWRALLHALPGGAEEAPATPGDDPGELAPEITAGEPEAGSRLALIVTLAVLWAVAVLVAILLALRYRAPATAAAAYRRLRGRFSARGARLPDSLPPLGFLEVARRHPEAAEPAARIVELYLRESFGGHAVDEAERRELKDALGRVARGLRRGS